MPARCECARARVPARSVPGSPGDGLATAGERATGVDVARVYVSLGTNVDRERNLRAAVAELDARFAPVRVSQVYETRAVGFRGDPFLNAVAGFDTSLELESLLDVLRAIETRSGRTRTDKRYGPRTLDIDVLTYGGVIRDDDAMDVPRSDITRRAFVLVPLAQLAPDASHPVLGERYADLVKRLKLDTSGMQAVDFAVRGPS
jgi:2-amino-4-hydroxy-6-hydroxymethyldihydropteridine diphosphokinase